MPSATLFGCRLRNLSTDFTVFYFLVAIVQVVWLFIYWIGIVAFSRPQTCAPGTKSSPQQWDAVFLLLGLFIAQAAITVAAVFVSLKGTPLEPSKRRWLAPLSYAFLASAPITAGLLAYAAWVVEAGDGSCWSSGNKSMPATIVFGAIGVLVGQLVGVLLTYNQLSDVLPGVRWHAVTRTGISTLVHLCGSFRKQHRGPAAVLEELTTQLQLLMCGIDADKSDVAAGLACASLLQREAAAGAGAASSCDDAYAASAPAGQLQNGGQLGAAGPGAAGSAGAAAQAPCEAAGSKKFDGSSTSADLLAWAGGVCQGAAAAVAVAAPETVESCPAGADAAGEALHWARYAAAAYGARQHMWRRGKRSSWSARRELRRLAAAAAAEGAEPLAGWGTGATAAAAAGAASTTPASQAAAAAAPSKSLLREFAAARELLGPDCTVVWFRPGDERRGLLPHLLAVDRDKKAVVLGIAGNWQRPHAVPAVQPAPLGWLAHSSAAEAERGAASGGKAAGGGRSSSSDGDGSSSWVHEESLAAAEALFQELEHNQLLQQLLRPGGSAHAASATLHAPAPGAEGAAHGAAPAAGPTAAAALVAAAVSELDCCGWPLVVAGHGVGAGAAALLALKLSTWQLGPLAVWAYGPPGELCSAEVEAVLTGCCSMTSVVVGDDVAPRATSAALCTLVDQAVVGLARLRYPKVGLLAALVAEWAGPRHWRGRWLNPARALRPLSEVPAEPLGYLHRYWRSRQQQQQEQNTGRQAPSGLCGRMLWLSRRAAALAAPAPSASTSSSADGNQQEAGAAVGATGAAVAHSTAMHVEPTSRGGCPPALPDSMPASSSSHGSDSSGPSNKQCWQAEWLSREQVAAWGIRVSPHSFSDHYVSRLLGVLGGSG